MALVLMALVLVVVTQTAMVVVHHHVLGTVLADVLPVLVDAMIHVMGVVLVERLEQIIAE